MSALGRVGIVVGVSAPQRQPDGAACKTTMPCSPISPGRVATSRATCCRICCRSFCRAGTARIDPGRMHFRSVRLPERVLQPKTLQTGCTQDRVLDAPPGCGICAGLLSQTGVNQAQAGAVAGPFMRRPAKRLAAQCNAQRRARKAPIDQPRTAAFTLSQDYRSSELRSRWTIPTPPRTTPPHPCRRRRTSCTTTNFAPRRLPSISAWPTMRAPDMP